MSPSTETFGWIPVWGELAIDVVVVGLWHEQHKDDVHEQSGESGTADSEYDIEYAHHGRVNIEIIGYTGANTCHHLVRITASESFVHKTKICAKIQHFWEN